jgi:hypothetical protein
MCNGSSPVAGPPIHLPQGQTLTQSVANVQAPISKVQAKAETAGTAASDAPAQATATRGRNLNISA